MLQLSTPVISTFVLDEFDPTGEAKVSFRQATTLETQQRDQLVFGGQAKTYTADGLRIEQSIPWSVREEIECRLTMCGTEAILDADGKSLFRFKDGKLAMSPDQFHKAWGKLPPAVATILHEHCLDAKPDWDYRINPTQTPPSGQVQDGEGSAAENGTEQS